MKTIKIIFLYLFFGLSFLVRGQAIGNYVCNGSFEHSFNCASSNLSLVKNWSSIDSSCNPGVYFSVCNSKVPLSGSNYQYPRTGQAYALITAYWPNNSFAQVTYPKNRLKSKLQAGHSYCVSFYVNIFNSSSYGIDGFGVYFGDDNIDTINYCHIPLTFLTPQVQNASGNVITDTLNWVAITGTFTANGTEKFLLLGNFLANNIVSTQFINPANSFAFTDACIDDVSCIEFNLPAYAGKDSTIYLGDSLFIGRQSDFAIDPGCIWYKFPNMTTPLDTISGIWVKPTTTSTYVVRQVLDCSPLKWDTVVVTVSTNYVGLDKLQNLSDNINLFPNPTSGNLSISGFSSSDISYFNITNCLGQNVLSGDIIQKNNLIIIGTSELEAGLYQIHLRTQYGIVTKKFVKTN